MQPVTIKPDQYFNTLWISQGLWGLLLIVGLILSWVFTPFYACLVPVALLGMWVNHKTIQSQQDIGIKMQASGELFIQQHTASGISSGVAEVVSFWTLPAMLLLKIKHPNHIIYTGIRRSVIGPVAFSQLLMGITQLEASNEQ